MELHQLLNPSRGESAVQKPSRIERGNLYAAELYSKQQVFRTNLKISARLAGGRAVLYANCPQLTEEHFTFDYIEPAMLRDLEKFIGLDPHWFDKTRIFHSAEVIGSARSVNVASLITDSEPETAAYVIHIIESFIGVVDSFADTSFMLSDFFEKTIDIDADSDEACSAIRTFESALGLELGSLDSISTFLGEA